MAQASVVSWPVWGALAAALLVLGFALIQGLRERGQAAGDLRAAWLCSAVLVVGWAAAAFRLAPSSKALVFSLAVLGGGVVGGALALGPLRASPSRLRTAGNLAGVVALFAAVVLIPGDSTTRQWAALGLPLGLALPALAAGLFRHEEEALSGAAMAALGTALAGALIWADRAYPAHLLGAGAVLGFAGAVVLAMAIAARAMSGPGPGPAVAAGALAALAAYPLLALALRQPTLALAAAAGGVLAAVLAVGAALGSEAAEEPPPVLGLILLVLAGGTLLLINRLFGMAGLGLAGIGLCAVAASEGRAIRWLAALLPAIFGGRALLHLFLDSTYLRVAGVDVTQTYAFAALILGFVVATALVRFRDRFAPGPWSGGTFALLLAASPVLVGYFIHLLPLAGFLAGILAAGFGLAALCDGLERGAARLGAYVALATAGAAAAAPFLTGVINAPRHQRLIVFLCLSGVVAWYAASAWRSQPRSSAAA